MSDATTVLFGLPGVRVERFERHADGTLVVDVVTDEPTAPACPSCGVVSTSMKDRVVTSPKDIPHGEDRIVVRWKKVRWRYREAYCKRGSFTEAITQVPARARSTLRLRQQMAKAVRDAAHSVAEVTQAHAVSWPTAHRAFVAHAEQLLTEPAPTPVLGIDETRRGKPSAIAQSLPARMANRRSTNRCLTSELPRWFCATARNSSSNRPLSWTHKRPICLRFCRFQSSPAV